MKRFILFLISSCVAVSAYSQEEILLDSVPKIQREVAVKELYLEKPLLFENEFSIGEISLFDKSMFNQPLLPNYSKNFDFKKYLNFTKPSSESGSIFGYFGSPFYTNGMVFNQTTYRLNDKFSFGGNSFGVQSVFDKSRINSSINEMSTKGASMFMQYKVSKNIKIETRVSVTSHNSPWGP